MTRHVLTDAERAKGHLTRSKGHRAYQLRREAEMWLLDRLLAEAAMPERYPER